MILRHALFSVLLAAPLFAQGEVDLRTTAKKGTAVWLQQDEKRSQIMEASGQEFESSQTIHRAFQVAVLSVDDKGNLVIEVEIARIHGAISIPMVGDIEFDSLDKPKEGEEGEEDEESGGGFGPDPATIKKSMMMGAGKKFQARVSPNGKVVELLEGAKEIMEGAGDGMPAASMRPLEEIIECAFGALPDNAVAVGGKWERKTKEEGQMPMEAKLDLTLAKADAETFEITTAGTLEKPAAPAADGKPKEDETGEDEQAAMVAEMLKGMKMKNGKITGAYKISRTDGFVIESSNATTVDIDMETPMGEMTMVMKMNTSVKRTTAAAAMAKKEAEKKEDAAKDAPKDAAKEEVKDPAKVM